MRLTENKGGTVDYILYDRIYWKEGNVRDSNWELNIGRLINSNYLIPNIYHEINRE
jgi:hypothetical protein